MYTCSDSRPAACRLCTYPLPLETFGCLTVASQTHYSGTRYAQDGGTRRAMSCLVLAHRIVDRPGGNLRH